MDVRLAFVYQATDSIAILAPGIGSSFQTVKQLCPNGEILDCFTIRGSSELSGDTCAQADASGSGAGTYAHRFDAIGTSWEIETHEALEAPSKQRIRDRIAVSPGPSRVTGGGRL